MLGAVRHKGFIPWDDDIDMVMFREDYDRLIRDASYLFKAPYFLQTTYSDEGYIHGHAQLRNSETTAIVKDEQGMPVKYNQGIFLDIFVLDGVYDDVKSREKQSKKIKLLNGFIYLMLNQAMDKSISKISIKGKVASRIFSFFGWNYIYWFKKKEDVLRNCRVAQSEYVAPLGFIYETEKRIRNKHLYDETVWLDFENMKVPAPAGYDEFLNRRYGDYMRPTQIPTTHGRVLFDTDRSYLEYREKNANG